ncbi:MAG: DNA integrity scanning diadenylate cyclase DisA [Nanoarchaeota archaeon]
MVEQQIEAEEVKKDIKEVQETIIPKQITEKVTREEFYSILKMVSPGTHFRTALDGALKTGKGALIAIESDLVLPIIDGGFRVNCRFTPQRLIELTKMDGAIILSKDMKRISYANVLLTPSSKIKTRETGTRHKAAERTAKQAGTLVIAISERRQEITLFYKNKRHLLKNTDELLRKANELIQLTEKQRELFDKNISELDKAELRNYESLPIALQVIQKGYLVQKIAEDIKKYLIELGNEGILLRTRLKEIMAGVEKDTSLVIKDYTKLDVVKSKTLLKTLSYDEILNSENILKVLGYEKASQLIPIRGWRILSKTSLSEEDIVLLARELASLGKAIHSGVKTIAEIVGEEKAKTFKLEIEKIKMNSMY